MSVQPPVHAYVRAMDRLRQDLVVWFPGVAVTTAPVSVPIYADYNSRDEPDDASREVETDMVVVSDVARTGTFAFVPLALYERGEILASVAPAGTLGERLRPRVLEILALRRESGDTWVCLGRERLPTRRFPTLPLRSTLREVLGS